MKKVRVENFRSISDSGMIDLCPITIAVGRNSAGKSSFIRLFPLLKQTLEKNTAEPMLWYGDYVDFGDYKKAVSKTNNKEPIRFSFVIEDTIEVIRKSGLKTQIKVTLDIREKQFEKIIIEFKDQIIEMIYRDKKGNSNRKVDITINGDSSVFEGMDIIAISMSRYLIPGLFQKIEEKEITGWTSMSSGEIQAIYAKRVFGKTSKVEHRWSPFFSDYGISVGSREEILKQLKEIDSKRFGKLEIKHKRFAKYNNNVIALYLYEIIERINIIIQKEMRETSYVKPIRATANRYYRVQGISINELDSDGSNLPMILKNMQPNKLREFEQWSKNKFGIVFSVVSSEGHVSLIIRKEVGSKEWINMADTGYGYSQMLPIVMLLWMIHDKRMLKTDIDRTVIIEQPELHLHPAYQAKMMDVFVNMIKEAKEKKINLKIIIETHSETMINRLGLLVAYERVKKEDVNILVFEKEGNSTVINSRGYDADGVLRGWPTDFFAPEDIE